MKVINKLHKERISEVEYGECFIYEDEVFMLVCTNNNRIVSGICLEDGILQTFCDDEEIIKVNATVTIE